ncbi:hypothetical protein SELMODRAFT_409373 [Selaginella moellendorffii]|uniref:Uncharacterized protein n=1 Tax=Selaginella moellendorffii TaxID=88036 RepID=D8RB90_SELML|nr:hypothetical protein SELMODRAFT_409373 [Selaginella moellendorffii]
MHLTGTIGLQILVAEATNALEETSSGIRYSPGKQTSRKLYARLLRVNNGTGARCNRHDKRGSDISSVRAVDRARGRNRVLNESTSKVLVFLGMLVLGVDGRKKSPCENNSLQAPVDSSLRSRGGQHPPRARDLWHSLRGALPRQGRDERARVGAWRCGFPSTAWRSTYAAGKIIAIKEPRFKRGSTDGVLFIRVDDPSSIQDISSFAASDTTSSRPGNDYAAANSLKAEGNHFFGLKNWSKAIDLYSQCVKRCEAALARGSIAGDMENALRVGVLLPSGPETRRSGGFKQRAQDRWWPVKSTSRKARALEGLQEFEKAVHWLEKALELSPGSSTRMLGACKACDQQSKTGELDIDIFLLQENLDPAPKCSDFVGPVELIAADFDDSGCGVRLFATKDVKAAELLVVSRALATGDYKTTAEPGSLEVAMAEKQQASEEDRQKPQLLQGDGTVDVPRLWGCHRSCGTSALSGSGRPLEICVPLQAVSARELSQDTSAGQGGKLRGRDQQDPVQVNQDWCWSGAEKKLQLVDGDEHKCWLRASYTLAYFVAAVYLELLVNSPERICSGKELLKATVGSRKCDLKDVVKVWYNHVQMVIRSTPAHFDMVTDFNVPVSLVTMRKKVNRGLTLSFAMRQIRAKKMLLARRVGV